MSEDFLLLNSDKTEMLVIAPTKQIHHADQVTLFRLGWIIAVPYFRVFPVRALKVFRWFRMLQLEYQHIQENLIILHQS